MYLNKSFGRKRFKRNLGNANHLIITSLVGLDAIERGIVADIPTEMRMTWSPKSPETSARRARRLILDMALIRSVDAIDVYIRDAMRKLTLIQDAELRSEIDRANRSIFKKLKALEGTLKGLDELLCAMMAALVSWRNVSAHVEADDILSIEHRETLAKKQAEIASKFSGLDVSILINDYDSQNPPTFKEVASFINASHHYIQDLEGRLFAQVDPDTFLKKLVQSAIRTGAEVHSVTQVNRSKISEIWGRNPNDRPRYVHSLLQRNGLSNTRTDKGPSLELSNETIEKLANFSPNELNSWLTE